MNADIKEFVKYYMQTFPSTMNTSKNIQYLVDYLIDRGWDFSDLSKNFYSDVKNGVLTLINKTEMDLNDLHKINKCTLLELKKIQEECTSRTKEIDFYCLNWNNDSRFLAHSINFRIHTEKVRFCENMRDICKILLKEKNNF